MLGFYLQISVLGCHFLFCSFLISFYLIFWTLEGKWFNQPCLTDNVNHSIFWVVIFSNQILAAILGGFPTTLISSIKISLVGFTFGYVQYFTTSHHTQLSIWVHAMVIFLLDYPSSRLKSLFLFFILLQSLPSIQPKWCCSSFSQILSPHQALAFHDCKAAAELMESDGPVICDAHELVSRRQFIPLQPTSLTAFRRLFSVLYPGLEHTFIVGGSIYSFWNSE